MPASELESRRAPLDDAVPTPLLRVIEPPVAAAAAPPLRDAAPPIEPVDDVPAPACIVRAPPATLSADVAPD